MRGIRSWWSAAWSAVPQGLLPRGAWAWVGGVAVALVVVAVAATVGGGLGQRGAGTAGAGGVTMGATDAATGHGAVQFSPVRGAPAAPRPAVGGARAANAVLVPAPGLGAAMAAPAIAPSTGTGLGDAVVRRVEESASMTVRVQDVRAAFDALTAMAAGLGGYVQSSSLQTGVSADASGVGPQPAAASLVVAVPHPQYATFIKQAGDLGKVLTTSANGQDVTSQYVDLQGRITALKAERQSYLTLMGKATAIGDILQIQAALTGVQSQIEDLTGQLQVLGSLSAMATVAVSLTAPPVVVAPPVPHRLSPLQRVTAAFAGSVQALANGATALALALAWLLPWAALVLVGLLVYRRIGRRGARV